MVGTRALDVHTRGSTIGNVHGRGGCIRLTVVWREHATAVGAAHTHDECHRAHGCCAKGDFELLRRGDQNTRVVRGQRSTVTFRDSDCAPVGSPIRVVGGSHEDGADWYPGVGDLALIAGGEGGGAAEGDVHIFQSGYIVDIPLVQSGTDKIARVAKRLGHIRDL